MKAKLTYIILVILCCVTTILTVNLNSSQVNDNNSNENDNIAKEDFNHTHNSNNTKSHSEYRYSNTTAQYSNVKEQNKLRLKPYLKTHKKMEYYEIDHLYFLQLLMKTHKSILVLFYDDSELVEKREKINKQDPSTQDSQVEETNIEEYNSFDMNIEYLYDLYRNELYKSKIYIQELEKQEHLKTNIRFCLYKIDNTSKEEHFNLPDTEIIKKHFNFKSIPFFMMVYNKDHPHIYDIKENELSLRTWMELVMFPKLHFKTEIILKNSRIYPYYLVYLGDNIDTYLYLKELSVELNVFEIDYCIEDECIQQLKSHFGGVVLFINGKLHVYDLDLHDPDKLVLWVINYLVGINKKIDRVIAHLLFKLNFNKVVMFVNKTELNPYDIGNIENSNINNSNNTNTNNTSISSLDSEVYLNQNYNNLFKVYENIAIHYFGQCLFFNSGIESDTEKILMQYLSVEPEQGFPQFVYIGHKNHHMGYKTFSIRNILNAIKETNELIPDENNSDTKLTKLESEFGFEYFNNDDPNPFESSLLSNLTLNAIEQTIYRLVAVNSAISDYQGLDLTQPEFNSQVIKDDNFLSNSQSLKLKSYSHNFIRIKEYQSIIYPFFWNNKNIIISNEINNELLLRKLEGDVILLTRNLKPNDELTEEENNIIYYKNKKEEEDYLSLFSFYLENEKYINIDYETKLFFVVKDLSYKEHEADPDNNLYYIHKSKTDLKRFNGIKKTKFERHLKDFNFDNIKFFMKNLLEEHLIERMLSAKDDL